MPKHGQKITWFCMVLHYISITSSIVCPRAYGYFDTDQSGTATNLEPVFDTHPERLYTVSALLVVVTLSHQPLGSLFTA